MSVSLQERENMEEINRREQESYIYFAPIVKVCYIAKL
jgi:hypothetical protein